MMTASCGLICSQCPAFLATRADDDAMRQKTAGEWSQMYNAPIKAEMINCEGCLSVSGKLFSHCHTCEIRACCIEKEFANCAPCDNYPCDKLDFIHQNVPDARQVLNKIREQLGK